MPKLEKDLKLTRVNVNLPTPLVNRVKDYSIRIGVPTTQGIVLLLTKALDNDDIVEQLPQLFKMFEELKEYKENS